LPLGAYERNTINVSHHGVLMIPLSKLSPRIISPLVSVLLVVSLH